MPPHPGESTKGTRTSSKRDDDLHFARHSQEEEIFYPALRDAGLDLAQLGQRFLERKQELMPTIEQQLDGTGGNGSMPSP